MKKVFLMILFLLATSSNIFAEIVTEEVKYSADGVELVGYLAYDDQTDNIRPGILVVHEWWGHNDYARTRAKMLAELGYVAFAVDMYGDGKKANHPEEAGAFVQEATKNAETSKMRFLAAMEVLKENQYSDPNNIAAIGYCFGGATVLNMARLGVDLKGVVSFHGSLGSSTPAQKDTTKAKVLVCHGAEDSFITQEQIDQFNQEMKSAEVDYNFISYEGAKHSFTNPLADKFAEEFGLGIGYNKAADEKSWQDMISFFNSLFNI